MFWRPAILPSGDAGTVTATVLEQKDATTWTADAAHFTQGPDRIKKGACPESRYNRVEQSIPKSEMLCVHDRYLRRPALARLGEHTWLRSMVMTSAPVR